MTCLYKLEGDRNEYGYAILWDVDYIPGDDVYDIQDYMVDHLQSDDWDEVWYWAEKALEPYGVELCETEAGIDEPLLYRHRIRPLTLWTY